MTEYMIENDISEEDIEISTSYRVRSLFHSPKIFDDYDAASAYYEQCLDENEFDMVLFEESTDSGWVEL